MSDKATPRPWAVNGFGGDFVVLATLRPMGVCISATNPDHPVDEIENARLIVVAVNAYEAHQRAAEALRKLAAGVSVLAGGGQAVRGNESLPGDAGEFYRGYNAGIKSQVELNVEIARAALAELDKVQR